MPAGVYFTNRYRKKKHRKRVAADYADENTNLHGFAQIVMDMTTDAHRLEGAGANGPFIWERDDETSAKR
jgi:hypothetical protein